VETAEPPSYPPADPRRRSLARALDLCIGLLPLVLVPGGHPRAGALLSAILLVAGDSLFGTGRSLGKRVAGLRVISLRTRRPAGIEACLRRDAIFAVAPLPALLGAPHPLALTVVALLVVCAVEATVALRPLTRDFGHRRLGDLLAGTQVIDGSIAVGLASGAPADSRPAAAPLVSSRAARGLQDEATAGPHVPLEPVRTQGKACASP
jgi:uncharacterized RDD family membrane protein YckC